MDFFSRKQEVLRRSEDVLLEVKGAKVFFSSRKQQRSSFSTKQEVQRRSKEVVLLKVENE
jgi:hypothetical protein